MSDKTLNLTPALQAHRQQDADACLREVTPILNHAPHHAVALHLKAWAISRRGEDDKALEILSEVVEQNPAMMPAKAEYGALLMANRRHTEALEPLREAFEAQPQRDEVALKYCICLIKNRRFTDAETRLHDLLARSPHHFQARYALAIAQLHLGKWEQGFDHYQIRFWLDEMEQNRGRQANNDLVEWQGEQIEGKTIVIECEQTSADQILFLRYAKWLKDTYQPGKIIVHARPAMRSLLETVEGVDEVVTSLEGVDANRRVSLLNLPYYHKTTPESIFGNNEAYLSAPEDKVEKWQKLLSDEKPKIAICWRTNLLGEETDLEKEVKSLNRNQADHLCQQIRTMFQDAEILSLQPTSNKKERSILKRHQIIDVWNNTVHDFADTAAVINEVDLVVSIDTSIAHIAAAMAKPVWNLLPYNAHWRWSQDEEYSDWYANMRLFRQSEENDWKSLDRPDELLAELASETTSG